MEKLTPDELLTTTRAVRRRLDFERPVPLELVEECLRIALQAPTGSNAQQWHWVVVTDPDRKAAIGEYYRKSFAAYVGSARSAGRLVTGDLVRAATQQRVGQSAAYLAARMGQVPVQVIPCIRVPATGLPAGTQASLWGSILPAAWSYMLAARARGLGTAWTTLHLTYETEIAELLGIPDNIRQAALIPTAFTTGADFKPAAREPLETVLHLDAW